jgi:hypothetical protein
VSASVSVKSHGATEFAPATTNMSGQDAFKRFLEQLQQSNGGRAPRPPKGTMGAAGVIVALVGGGLLLSASLFNGSSPRASLRFPAKTKRLLAFQSMVVIVLSSILGSSFHSSRKTPTDFNPSIHGVKPDVYTEGTHFAVWPFFAPVQHTS